MTRFELSPAPSWSVPIALGSFATLLLLLLFTAGQSVAVPQVALASACCCAAGFLPYGFVPAWIAASRDPRLTRGQGFAVAFIAVGLGTVIWAALSSINATPLDAGALREGYRAAQEGLPPEQRLSDERVEEIVELTLRVAPYAPAVYATVTTVLAGFVGMLAVGIRRRSRRSAEDGA